MYKLTELQRHLEEHWQVPAKQLLLQKGPVEKLDPSFRILEFPPGPTHAMWVYSTLGMSLSTPSRLIELHLFSDKQDSGLVELLTACASYHRNDTPLGLYHTVSFGRPWQDKSACSYGYISLPYLDGEALELFKFATSHLHNLWLIPITERERAYKIEKGWERLEEAFEAGSLDYTNPRRNECIP
jgi:hypothetical protein